MYPIFKVPKQAPSYSPYALKVLNLPYTVIFCVRVHNSERNSSALSIESVLCLRNGKKNALFLF